MKLAENPKRRKHRRNPGGIAGRLKTALSHPVSRIKTGATHAFPVAVGAVANYKLNQLLDAQIAQHAPSVSGQISSVVGGCLLGVASSAIPKYGQAAFEGAFVYQMLRLLAHAPMLAVKIGEYLTGEEAGGMGEVISTRQLMGEALGVDALAPDFSDILNQGQVATA